MRRMGGVEALLWTVTAAIVAALAARFQRRGNQRPIEQINTSPTSTSEMPIFSGREKDSLNTLRETM